MSGSSASVPGASPEASCHDEVAIPLSLSFFFDSFGATVPSLVVLTTDQEPAAVPEAAGATGSAGGIGSAGLGAGVHEGSLGAGLGVGSGAGRESSRARGVGGPARPAGEAERARRAPRAAGRA